MGKLQNNLYYFKISKDNQEKLLDDIAVDELHLVNRSSSAIFSGEGVAGNSS